MPELSRPYTVLFPSWFEGQFEHDTLAKGYLRDVEIRFDEGARYRLYFTDPIRLKQDAEVEFETGQVSFGEPGLIVVPEVTRANILAAVDEIYDNGFFTSLRPVQEEKNVVSSSHS